MVDNLGSPKITVTIWFYGNLTFWDTFFEKPGFAHQPSLHTDRVCVRLAVSGCVSVHSVLVNEDGKAMTFGRNPYGQLGLDNTTSQTIPQIVPAFAEHEYNWSSVWTSPHTVSH
ncbi:hypothetical protein NQ317_019864 [Molorchus minor]|uniref:Uncharacterized protein n=1 Tax=Molorchus minor TaxID=1323400 RepID=A0ABQ9IUG7_9CUCU|nr:hypothetical protein NQ317_019864 [Molorchus minor]